MAVVSFTAAALVSINLPRVQTPFEALSIEGNKLEDLQYINSGFKLQVYIIITKHKKKADAVCIVFFFFFLQPHYSITFCPAK